MRRPHRVPPGRGFGSDALRLDSRQRSAWGGTDRYPARECRAGLRRFVWMNRSAVQGNWQLSVHHGSLSKYVMTLAKLFGWWFTAFWRNGAGPIEPMSKDAHRHSAVNDRHRVNVRLYRIGISVRTRDNENATRSSCCGGRDRRTWRRVGECRDASQTPRRARASRRGADLSGSGSARTSGRANVVRPEPVLDRRRLRPLCALRRRRQGVLIFIGRG